MPHYLTLKITLRDTKPPVWRRVVVPMEYTFWHLHTVIQVAMGWDNDHLWQFWDDKRGGQSVMIGPKMDGDFDDQLDADLVPLSEYLHTEGQKFLYTYDMGDNWEHQLLVEAVGDVPADARHYPVCLAGEGACPPEDCGGAPGFEALLTALHAGELPEWFEGYEDFDPQAFDLEAVNATLAAQSPR